LLLITFSILCKSARKCLSRDSDAGCKRSNSDLIVWSSLADGILLYSELLLRVVEGSSYTFGATAFTVVLGKGY
jgi:hypothetical protein